MFPIKISKFGQGLFENHGYVRSYANHFDQIYTKHKCDDLGFLLVAAKKLQAIEDTILLHKKAYLFTV